ncbi:hypothetical protein KQI65_09710 [bacterium]|nr:hypothetical protein [bacterium]
MSIDLHLPVNPWGRLARMLLLTLFLAVVLPSCSDDANEPAKAAFPTIIAPEDGTLIPEGENLVIELAGLDSTREKDVFYRVQGALFYHPVTDRDNMQIVHKLTSATAGRYRLDFGVRRHDDTQELFDTRYFTYISE